MNEFFRSMTYPLLACLLLAGIHVYLGIHVISRGVIFVDLALAQIAALGAVSGVLLGYDLDSNPWAIKAFSLSFAILGAAVFSLTRTRQKSVPHEAVIGIAYAVAMAATILVSSQLAHGSEEMTLLLSGNILWVRQPTILVTLGLYSAIGLFHYLCRRKFLLLSLDPERARREGVSVHLWDFLFYVSFGVVVTSSVGIAGVLLVFSFLVIPAVIAVLFAERIGTRLAIGWIVGGAISFLGVCISYWADLPSGPTIVVSLAAALVLSATANYVLRAPARGRALLRTAGSVALALLLVTLGGSLRKHDAQDPLELLRSSSKEVRISALRALTTNPDLWHRCGVLIPTLLQDPEAEVRAQVVDLVEHYQAREHLPGVQRLLGDTDDHVRELVLKALRRFEDPSSVAALVQAAGTEKDEYVKAEIGETLLELGDGRGFSVLLDVMDRGTIPQARKDAAEHLGAHSNLTFPFDAARDPGDNDAEIAPFRQWWDENQFDLDYDPVTGVYGTEPTEKP